jgi:signal transduction histidine kinase
LRFVISILVPSTAFQRIIEEQHLPTSWSPVILDGDWTVVARDISRSKFLGQKGAAQEFQNAPDGLHEVRLLDGDRALSAHSHSRRYGWTAAVAMPTSAMMGEALTPILPAALSGFAVAALAIGAVLFFAARIGGNIASLAAVTRALATGERIELPRFLVRELAMVGDGMQQAAAEIAASRYDLEARIAEATRELHRESEEHRRAEAALAQAQKMEAIGQLTGGIAHDFNNLLTAIQGSIELIDRQAKLDPETLARLLGPARSAAERGAALTHGLLAFSRQQALSTQDIDINRHVGGISELLRRTLGEAIVIEAVLAGGLCRCFVDPNQLESALLNIAVNARDAMPDGGKLTIETGNTYLDEEYAAIHEDVLPGQYVLLAITDTGTGMSPEIMAHALEPFFTTKESGKGTGLGLSQVYGFVKQSGGHIKLYSEVGLGTTVKVYLPRSTSEAMAEQVPDRSASIPSGNGETVLLVEDDAEVREFSASALAHLGYRVLEASEASTALNILAEHSEIALLLTDVGLPGLNGRQLAEEARRRVPRLKVIYMTGYARNAVVHHGVLDAGVDLLAKPFTTDGLGRKLQEVLRRD